MSLSHEEIESKAQMLAYPPDPSNPYSIPSNVGDIDRESIESRADIIRRQNDVIARFNRWDEEDRAGAEHPPPAPATPSATIGGKRSKKNKSKKNKSKKNKSKRIKGNSKR